MPDQRDKNFVRLLLLNNEGLFRRSLAHFLAGVAGFAMAGKFGTTGEALEMLRQSQVDVVLLDWDLGSEQARNFMSAARASGYGGRFLIVAEAPDAEVSAAALKLGASGIFLKSDVPERLVEAIQVVAKGGVWLDRETFDLLADQCLNRRPEAADQNFVRTLNDREQKVLLGLIGGLTNRKIAEVTGLTEASVKGTLDALFGKTGTQTRSQLVRIVLTGSSPSRR